MISKYTIDKVFETAQIDEVIGEFVHLKKAGSNYKGLSPFSEEKTPSFVVSPVKQIWKDFSTGKGGNAISFLMEHEHYTYPEAIRYLAKKYNIEIEETEQTDAQKEAMSERESMFVVSEYARDHFQDNLFNTQKGKAIGLSYFRERGFTDETIKRFELGYCLDDWTGFTDAALSKGYDINYLEKTGLTIVKEGGKQFDRFKARVMFPIHSMSGRVLGFGGRILTNDKKAAKYLNSPESDIYHKSHILYGLYQAKQTIVREDNCFLVEGYTDVISFSQNGVANVVASSGTALTPDQIRLVRRLTPNITILFDGDAAGIRASLRGIDLILEQGMNVRVLTFPDGDDPDSFSKRVSTEELKEYLANNAQDFINFKVSLLMEEAKQDPVKKASLIRDIVVSISKIPDQIQREVYLQECSRIMDISESVLFNELAQILSNPRNTKPTHNPSNVQQNVSSDPNEPPIEAFMDNVPPHMMVANKGAAKKVEVNELYNYEREIVRILLLFGNKEVNFIDIVEDEKGEEQKAVFESKVSREVYLNLQEDEIEFTNEIFKGIYFDIINQLNQEQDINVDSFINHQNPSVSAFVTDILMEEEKHVLSNWTKREVHVRHNTDKIISKAASDIILNLRRVLIQMKIDALQKENVSATENNDTTLEEIVNYLDLKSKIYGFLHRVM